MSALLGGRQMCIFDQFCDPALGAPIHCHVVEEVLEVIEGSAEVCVGKGSAILKPNQSVLVPAGAPHSFRNLENATLHIRATLAAPIFEAAYGDSTETSRRWMPVTSISDRSIQYRDVCSSDLRGKRVWYMLIAEDI